MEQQTQLAVQHLGMQPAIKSAQAILTKSFQRATNLHFCAHTKTMKLINAIAAGAVIGTSFIATSPANASIQVWLNKGTIVYKNDGIPTYGVAQGCTANFISGGAQLGDEYEYVRYPIKGKGFNHERTQKLTDKGAKFASRVIWNNSYRSHFSIC